MKKLILLLIIAFLSTLTSSAQKEVDIYKIQVDGLGCPFCAFGLEKKFKEFKGIKKVAIEIETGNFSFTYPSDKPLTLNAVTDQVKKAGYTPVTAEIIRANGEIETLSKSIVANEKAENLSSKNFLVQGNCDMCKARIEAAALEINGVQNAVWNKDSKEITLQFNKDKTAPETIGKEIAKAGHDNAYAKAADSTYADLPVCCIYRNTTSKTH